MYENGKYLKRSIGIEDGIQMNEEQSLYEQCTFLQEEVNRLYDRRVAVRCIPHFQESLRFILQELEERALSALSSHGFRRDVFSALLSLHSVAIPSLFHVVL